MRGTTESRIGRAALIGALVIGLLGVSAREGRAELIVANSAIFEEIEDSGIWRWEYTLALGPSQLLRTGSVFTIYDFQGYLGGDDSLTLLPDTGMWTASPTPIGITPTGLAGGSDPAPPDSPVFMNLSWVYAGPDFSAPVQTNIGIFSALSMYAPPEIPSFNDWFAGEAYLDANPDQRVFNSEDNIMVPENPVPEPGSMLLLSTGLFGAAAVLRRRRKAQAAIQPQV